MYCQVSPALSNNLLNMAYLFFLKFKSIKKKRKKKKKDCLKRWKSMLFKIIEVGIINTLILNVTNFDWPIWETANVKTTFYNILLLFNHFKSKIFPDKLKTKIMNLLCIISSQLYCNYFFFKICYTQ